MTEPVMAEPDLKDYSGELIFSLRAIFSSSSPSCEARYTRW